MPKDSDSSPEKDKVLDLLDTTKKPSRRERQRQEAAGTPPGPSALDKAKSEALDLFSDEKKPKVRKRADDAKPLIGAISKILEQEDPNMVKAAAPDPTSAPAPDADDADDADASSSDELSDDTKLIVIKPPILVPELAARLGLKPFNIMADLIKIGVFPAPNQLSLLLGIQAVAGGHGLAGHGAGADEDLVGLGFLVRLTQGRAHLGQGFLRQLGVVVGNAGGPLQ